MGSVPGIDRSDETLPRPRSRPLRGLSFNFAATVAILLLNLTTGVILARAFEPAIRGELAAVLLWPNLVIAVGILGLPQAMTFYSARRSDGSLLGSGLAVAVAVGAASTIVGLAILPLVLGRYSDAALTAGYIYLAHIPLQACNLLLFAYINGRQRFATVAALRILVIGAVAMPLAMLFVLDELTLLRAAAIYVGAQLVTFIATAVALRADLRKIRVRSSAAAMLLRYGVKAHPGAVSTNLNARVDQLVISLVLSARDLGLYVVAVTITTMTGVIGATVGFVALPILAAATDDVRRAFEARRYISLTVLISIALSVPVLIALPQLIELLFGSAYSSIADVARLLLIAAVGYSTARGLEGILQAIDKPWQASLGELVALGVTAVALAVLLPRLELTGAALASLLAYFTSVAWMLRVTGRSLGVASLPLLLPHRSDLAAALRLVRAHLGGRSNPA